MLMPSVYTILFLEECPLACQYCDMMAQSFYKKDKPFTKEQLFAAVEDIVTKHSTPNPIRVLFTGGEPLIRWGWIKEIMLKYGTSIQYAFNTSGYLLTEDIVKFCKDYAVQWVLSVDGGKQISMWQRPTRNGKYDYWETVTKIFPMLLYYFPNTRWKSILSRQLIPHVAEIWGEAERQGFRHVWFVRDFGDTERNYSNAEGGCVRKVLKQAWTDADWEALAEQYQIIAEQMYVGMANGCIRTFESRMLEQMQTLLVPTKFQTNGLSCGVLAGRGMRSMYGADEQSQGSCLYGIEVNRGKTMKQLAEELTPPVACPKNPDCPFFYGCRTFGCVKDCFDATGDYYTPSNDECRHSLVAGNAVLHFLNLCNEHLTENKFYKNFLWELQEGGDIYVN